ncbi:MAG: preprotein translocase subunit SecG [Gemmatimonadota bacterium]
MFGFLVAVITILAVMLVVIVLLQSAKGGGLAASFGGASSSTDSFMGGRQTASALTKMTWAGGGLFLFLALVLSVMSSRPTAGPESILREGIGTQPALPDAPPSLLDAPQEAAPAGDAGADDTSAVEPGASDPDSGGN